MANAERYYRVMTTSSEAQEAARAFKAVSATWLARQQTTSNVAAVMAASEVRHQWCTITGGALAN